MAEKKQATDLLKGEDSSFNIGEILHMFLSNWYWFLVSVILCLFFGWYTLQKAIPTYKRMATVLIKDNSSGSMSESAVFEDIATVRAERNVSNEMLVFKSNRLMQIVARRLHLDVNYLIEEGLHMKELYTQAPISVRFFDVDEAETLSLTVLPHSEKEVTITDIITSSGASVNKSFYIPLNDTVSTPIGRILISPTLYYQ